MHVSVRSAGKSFLCTKQPLTIQITLPQVAYQMNCNPFSIAAYSLRLRKQHVKDGNFCVLIVNIAFSKVPGGMEVGKGLLATHSSRDAAQDLAQDISLGSEAEEMIAAWKGSKVIYDDGSNPYGLAQDLEHICKQVQRADDSNDYTTSEVRKPIQQGTAAAFPQ